MKDIPVWLWNERSNVFSRKSSLMTLTSPVTAKVLEWFPFYLIIVWMDNVYDFNYNRKKKKVYFPNSAGWTPNKQFCFCKSAPFRILSPPSKLWYHICSQMVQQWWTWSCGLRVTCSRSQRSDCSPLLFLFCFSPPNALFFLIDHTTKLGMKDLLKTQQWWVERFEPDTAQSMPNALTTTPCSPTTPYSSFFLNNHKLKLLC